MINLRQEKNILLFLLPVAAVMLRIPFLGFRSQDFIYYMGRWWRFIEETGLLSSFRFSFDDYPPAYLHLLSLTTLLPLGGLLSVKLLSFLFEALAAYFSFRLVALFATANRALYTGALFLLIPTVILNGACWGQSDIIYTSLALGALYLLAKGSYGRAFLLLGCAFAFKLQTVFFLPVFVLFWLRGAFPWSYFLALPATYLITIIPSLLAGRNRADLLMIYYSQTKGVLLSSNVPNIYTWFPSAAGHFELANASGIAVAFILTALALYLIHRKKGGMQINAEDTLLYGLLFCTLLPFLLPQMRERYFFPADILSFLYCFGLGRYYWVCGIITGCSALTYIRHLYGIHLLEDVFLSMLLLTAAVFLSAKACLGKDRKNARDLSETGHPQPKTNYHP
jgi:Gpi18-like mannosyltransferase